MNKRKAIFLLSIFTVPYCMLDASQATRQATYAPTAPLEKLGILYKTKTKPLYLPLLGQERWFELTPTKGNRANQKIHMLLASRGLTQQEKTHNQQSAAAVDLFERIQAPGNAWIKRNSLLLSGRPENARGSMTFSPDGSLNLEHAAHKQEKVPFQSQKTITLGML